MEILKYAFQSPCVLMKIKCGIRFISIATAAGIPYQNITNYDPAVQICYDYLEQEYLQELYSIHSPEPSGFDTIHPIDNGVIDTVKDLNYFEMMTKIKKYVGIIYDKSKFNFLIE